MIIILQAYEFHQLWNFNVLVEFLFDLTGKPKYFPTAKED